MSGEGNGEGDTPGRRRRRRKRRTPASDPAPATQPPAAPKTGSTTGKTGKAGAGGKAKRAGSRVKRTATPKGPVLKEVSAGGVVYRRDGDEIEVILASRRTRRGELAWGLAKGGIEEGESLEEAAAREVTEETGIVAEIEGSLGDTRYFYVWEDARIRKTVHFFLMRATGGDTADRDDEMEEVRWFPLERAMKRAAYRGEREVLGRAAELLR
ncbi:MAG: NUDIX hydrolase [Actinomycetota bacterium]|nr:NUDIX hydrolase [Actinomycetota bacterium]